MPKEFRTEFKTGRATAHVRKHNGSFEIRCQIKKQKICAVAKTLDEAKEKFIDKLKNFSPSEAEKRRLHPTFEAYALRWLDTVKKPYIKPLTYREYHRLLTVDIIPRFGAVEVGKVKQLDLQEFINGYVAAEKFRTAKKIYNLLSPLFDYAVNDGILIRSPLNNVTVPIYEQKHGSPLTREEEKQVVNALLADNTTVMQGVVFCLYTGLRRSELSTARRVGEWIEVATSKTRQGKGEKIRRIPISPMLYKVLPFIDIEKITALSPDTLTTSRAFHELLSSHHFHDLRHTFITRCQECGIPREIVSLWSGHSADNSITSRVYTHLEGNADLQLKEICKFSYEL